MKGYIGVPYLFNLYFGGVTEFKNQPNENNYIICISVTRTHNKDNKTKLATTPQTEDFPEEILKDQDHREIYLYCNDTNSITKVLTDYISMPVAGAYPPTLPKGHLAVKTEEMEAMMEPVRNSVQRLLDYA